MESKELVQKLVRGSENIDRMKKEIETVVRILLWLIHWSLVTESQSIHFPGGFWRLDRDGNCALFVECLTSSMLGGDTVRINQRGSLHIGYGDVQSVHDALPYLIQGILKLFPLIHIQPFLDAADYQFEPPTKHVEMSKNDREQEEVQHILNRQ